MKIKRGREKEYKDFLECNANSYNGELIIKYMRNWAGIMEDMIVDEDPNAIIPLIARQTSVSYEADPRREVTGFIFAWTIDALVKFWEYGEILRKWHNGEYNYDGEGVVNPAILTVKEE